jgi:hypothetical protein
MRCVDELISHVLEEAKTEISANGYARLPAHLEVVQKIQSSESLITGKWMENPRKDIASVVNRRIQRLYPRFPVLAPTPIPFKAANPGVYVVSWERHIENERVRGIALERENYRMFAKRAQKMADRLRHMPDDLSLISDLEQAIRDMRSCAERARSIQEINSAALVPPPRLRYTGHAAPMGGAEEAQ